MNAFRRLFQPMPLLRKLYLGNNKIEAVDISMFSNMTHLETLDMNYNSLSSIPDGAFDKLLALNSQSLRHNFLPSIASNTFSARTRARYFLTDNIVSIDFQNSLKSVVGLTYATQYNYLVYFVLDYALQFSSFSVTHTVISVYIVFLCQLCLIVPSSYCRSFSFFIFET